MPFIRLERKGYWLKVRDMDGDAHWVFDQAVTSQLRCLAIRASVTNLRQSPSSKAPLVDRPVADRYTPFLRIENQDQWYLVEDATGTRGWVHEANVWKPVVVQDVSF